MKNPTKRNNKAVIGFRCRERITSHGYKKLEIEIRSGSWVNLSKTYEDTGDTYDLNALKAVRDATGQTWILYLANDAQFSVTFQADNENPEKKWSRWYAPRIDNGYFTESVSNLISKVSSAHVKAGRKFDETAESLVETLLEMGAVPVKYNSDAGHSRWLEDTEFTVESIAASPVEETETAPEPVSA